MYLPLYYMFEDTALGFGNPKSGLERWWKELPDTMAAYCKIFPMRPGASSGPREPPAA